jgi:hypothetical protein
MKPELCGRQDVFRRPLGCQPAADPCFGSSPPPCGAHAFQLVIGLIVNELLPPKPHTL